MEARESRHFGRYVRAYVLNDDSLPVYVSDGLGDLDYNDAVELSVIKRTAQGLPATREYISLFAPPPKKERTSHTSRGSKHNSYTCVHCDYKSTRYGNMITHLAKSHGDYTTDPRDNR